MVSSPDPSSEPGLQRPKGQRVLACTLCSQRKVRCDRKFPCANCIKSRAQCIPMTMTGRPRKRRFAERELLDRLRRYEDLLRQNNVSFEPLSKEAAGERRSFKATDAAYDSDSPEGSTPSMTTLSEKSHGAKYAVVLVWRKTTTDPRRNLLQVMRQGVRHFHVPHNSF
jgi:hypothetical protein